MSEWHVLKGRAETDPVALAREREVVECELDGRAFVFACEVVPNQWSGKGVAVMMNLAEHAGNAGDPICVRDLAAAFEDDELPQELDLATIVTCRTRAEGLFASAADMVKRSDS
jgi:hypothetical protein